MQRPLREAGVPQASVPLQEEVLGFTNPYFDATGEQLKRAAMRYIQIPQGPVTAKVRVALSAFVGPDMLFNGCSITSRQFTAGQVCDALMDCAKNADLVVPSVLASLRQFVVDIRMGDDGLKRFFGTSKGAPARGGSA